MEMEGSLWKRQAPINGQNGSNPGYNYGGYDGVAGNWWLTPTGMAVRYAIVAVLFGSIVLFFVGGYYHAQRRQRKGLPPFAYHRWMVRRSHWAPPPPPPRPYMYPHDPANQSYGLEGYPPPPPAYNNGEAPPPVYQPPRGGTKAMADQNFRETNRSGEGSGAPATGAPATGTQ